MFHKDDTEIQVKEKSRMLVDICPQQSHSVPVAGLQASLITGNFFKRSSYELITGHSRNGCSQERMPEATWLMGSKVQDGRNLNTHLCIHGQIIGEDLA